MKNIFFAVFSSVWKRKETKIFLAFSLYPLVFYLSTLFPNSEFMKIHMEDGYQLSLLELYSLLLGSINSLTLPILSLYYLTHTVFKKEIEDSVMFLYKDVSRQNVFWAKILSLVLIVVIFLCSSFVFTTFAHYTAVVNLPYGTPAVFPSTLVELAQTAVTILITSLDFLISVFIAMLLSLYFGSGVTMTSSLIIGIVTSILPIIGGKLAMIYPTGFIQLVYGNQLLFAFMGAIGISLCYILLLSGIGFKKFRHMEF